MLVFSLSVAARKTDILRVTEQILDAINNGDFDTYTYVSLDYLHLFIYIYIYSYLGTDYTLFERSSSTLIFA